MEPAASSQPNYCNTGAMEGWRGGEGRGGKEGVEREERNSHVDEPICLIGHGEGGREVA